MYEISHVLPVRKKYRCTENLVAARYPMTDGAFPSHQGCYLVHISSTTVSEGVSCSSGWLQFCCFAPRQSGSSVCPHPFLLQFLKDLLTALVMDPVHNVIRRISRHHLHIHKPSHMRQHPPLPDFRKAGTDARRSYNPFSVRSICSRSRSAFLRAVFLLLFL